MNVFTVAGNLGGDAEFRVAKSGTVVTTFSVPAKSGWGDNEKLTWVKCTLFGKKGSGSPHGLTEHLVKGRFVTVTGELELDQWEHEGKSYSQVKVMARDVSMGPAPGNAKPQQAHDRSDPGPQAALESFEDDIPF